MQRGPALEGGGTTYIRVEGDRERGAHDHGTMCVLMAMAWEGESHGCMGVAHTPPRCWWGPFIGHTHTHAHIHTTLGGGGLAMPSCDRDLHCAHSTAPTPSCAPLPCRCIYISHQPPLFSLTRIPPFTHVFLVCPTNEAARTTADHAQTQYPTCRRRSASPTHCHMGTHTHTHTHSKCASRVRVRASVRL